MFVKLTDTDNESVLIDVDSITCVCKADNKSCSLVHVINGVGVMRIPVKQSVDEIEDLI